MGAGNSSAVDFYQSDEWLELRYKAIKHYGKQCHCCGAAGGTLDPIHVDHIKPRSKYPELALDLANLQILCRKCNLGKRAWDATDWRPPTAKLTRLTPPFCAFCGRSKEEAGCLVGHESMICNLCVEICVELVSAARSKAQ